MGGWGDGNDLRELWEGKPSSEYSVRNFFKIKVKYCCLEKSFPYLQKQPPVNPAAVPFGIFLFISNRNKMHCAAISTYLYLAGLKSPYLSSSFRYGPVLAG